MQSSKQRKLGFSPINLLKNGYAQAAIIVATLLLFLLTKNIFFGVLIAIEIFGIVALEVTSGVKSHGLFHELKETIVALAVALLFWFGATILLNTSSPISAVASCSMLPSLDRGDFVIVQGSVINTYELNMSREEFNQLLNPAVVGNKSFAGSIYVYCLQKVDQLCVGFATNPELFKEQHGPLSFQYSKCGMTVNNKKQYEPCVSSVSFKGKTYELSKSHDTVVYQPSSFEIYSRIGDIVHRSQFRINVENETYYLTKGDNNPIFDIQVFDYSTNMGNLPVSQDRIKGKVIGRVPYLGYLKLFISGLFTEPAQCKTQLGEPVN